MAFRQHDSQRAEGRRRAQDRPHVMGIGHLIEDHDQRAIQALGQRHQIGDGEFAQRLDQGRDPLMHRALGKQPLDLLARKCLPLRPVGPGHPNLSPIGKPHEAAEAAPGIGQRGIDRVMAEQPIGTALVARFNHLIFMRKLAIFRMRRQRRPWWLAL